MANRPPATLPLIWPDPEPRAMTGVVELGLADALAGAGTRPERAGAVISAMFGSLAGQPVTGDLLRSLSTGTRAWLLAKAAAVTGRETGWFQAECQSCGAPFDIALRLADIPRGDPGDGFPVVTVPTSLGPRAFEVPNGWHEETLARNPGPDPRRRLVALLNLADTADRDAQNFSDVDLVAIETALDENAPDIGDRITATCPACSAETSAVIDPLAFALPRSETILRETHLIARAYGWREAAILSLPSQRRQAYARLIAAEARTGGVR
ncbi:hypothetical protein [Tabrizicola sp.]|uniref:hypothetical protein n=1 Tax=Tabrizicola sp. TaxID=2005166 RepID=UPI00286BC58E|nr:hypothetical protein [Tabrizicola sp.]